MNNCLNRNSVGSVFKLSSDINEFIRPHFDVSGATKIDCSLTGLTEGDAGVYLINNEDEIFFDFIFNTNNTSFVDKNESKFSFAIHKYNPIISGFNRLARYNSETFDWGDFSATTIINTSVQISDLDFDGEYIIKGNFLNKYSTEFMSLLQKTYNTSNFISGDEFGYYKSDRDYYFILIKKPEKPTLDIGGNTPVTVNSIRSASYDLIDGQFDIQVPETQSGYIVTLNGLVLSEYLDYNVTNITNNSVTVSLITLVSPGKFGDILTVSYIASGGNNTLITKIIDVNTPVPSGPQNSEDSNEYYLNTTTNKYEIFLDSDPLSQNDIILAINGAVLANDIDYYQSSSNPKRIILEGNILIGDIITVYYNSFTNIVGEILTDNPIFAWSIETAPLINNGNFTLEISTDNSFTNIINSDSIPYIVGQNSYFLPVKVNANYNDLLYYRVRNDKNYETICGQIITSSTYSDTTKIKLKVNSGNRY